MRSTIAITVPADAQRRWSKRRYSTPFGTRIWQRFLKPKVVTSTPSHREGYAICASSGKPSDGVPDSCEKCRFDRASDRVCVKVFHTGFLCHARSTDMTHGRCRQGLRRCMTTDCNGTNRRHVDTLAVSSAPAMNDTGSVLRNRAGV